MVADKREDPRLDDLLRTAAKEHSEFVPQENWADKVMKDIRQISLEAHGNEQHLAGRFLDYIDSVSMAFWRFVPAAAMVLLVFGILYSFYNPIDETVRQVWNNQHDAFLWLELLGI